MKVYHGKYGLYIHPRSVQVTAYIGNEAVLEEHRVCFVDDYPVSCECT